MNILPGHAPLVNMFGTSAGGGGQVTTLSLVESRSYNSASIILPATIQEGDLLVLLDVPLWAGSIGAGDDTPSGWTRIIFTHGSNGYGVRLNLCCKIAAASDNNATVAGGNGSTWDRKAFAIFRGNAPITAINIGDPKTALIGAQANKSVTTNAGSGNPPLIVLCVWYSDMDVSPRTSSVAKDGEQNIGDNYAFLGWKFYNGGATPANVTVSLSEAGASLNCTMAAYVEVS